MLNAIKSFKNRPTVRAGGGDVVVARTPLTPLFKGCYSCPIVERRCYVIALSFAYAILIDSLIMVMIVSAIVAMLSISLCTAIR